MWRCVGCLRFADCLAACQVADDTPVELSPMGHQVSIDANGESAMRGAKVRTDYEARKVIATLPDEVEEKALAFAREVVRLPSICVLLLHHIVNGGTYQNFAAHMEDVAAYITSHDLSRQEAEYLFTTMSRSFETNINLDALRHWSPGHGVEKFDALRSRERDLMDDLARVRAQMAKMSATESKGVKEVKEAAKPVQDELQFD